MTSAVQSNTGRLWNEKYESEEKNESSACMRNVSFKAHLLLVGHRMQTGIGIIIRALFYRSQVVRPPEWKVVKKAPVFA